MNTYEMKHMNNKDKKDLLLSFEKTSLKGRTENMMVSSSNTFPVRHRLFVVAVLMVLFCSMFFANSLMARERNRVITIPVEYDSYGTPIEMCRKIDVLPPMDESQGVPAINLEIKNVTSQEMSLVASATLASPVPGMEMFWNELVEYKASFQIYFDWDSRNVSIDAGIGCVGNTKLVFADATIDGPAFLVAENNYWCDASWSDFSGREYFQIAIKDFPEDEQMDFSAPTLSVDLPVEPLTSGTTHLWAFGEVSDASQVDAFLVEDYKGTFAPERDDQGNFMAKLMLAPEGETTLTFHMWDQEGNYSTEVRTVTVAPMAVERFITMDCPYQYDVSEDTVYVDAVVSIPTTHVAQVTFNGQEAELSGEWYWTELPTPEEGPFVVQVVAIDIYGNVCSDNKMVIVDIVEPVITINSPEPGSFLTGKEVLVEGTYDDVKMEELWCEWELVNFWSGKFSAVIDLGSPRRYEIDNSTIWVEGYDSHWNYACDYFDVTVDDEFPVVYDVSAATPVFDGESVGWLNSTNMPVPDASPFPSISNDPTGLMVACVNGKLHVHGIWTEISTDVSHQIYDPVGDSWSYAEPMTTPVNGGAIAASANKIYVFGGWNGSSIVNSVQVYDCASNSWSEGPPLPSARCDSRAISIAQKIYIFGGLSGSLSQPSYVDEVLIFDTSTGSYSNGSSMTEAKKAPGVCLLDGLIYVVGGVTGKNSYSSANEAYDPATDSWSQLSSMPTYRGNLGLANLDGKIYAIGGLSSVAEGKSSSLVEIFDPVSNSWGAGPSMSASRFGQFLCQDSTNIFAVGEKNPWPEGEISRTLIGVEKLVKGISAVEISGYFSDAFGLSSITAGGLHGEIDGETFRVTNVPTVEGESSTRIVAVDFAGNTTIQNVTFVADGTPPVLTVTSPVEGQWSPNPVVVAGIADDILIDTVTANGSFASLDGTSFTTSISLSDGAQTMSIVARDTSGNSTSTDVSFFVDSVYPTLSIDSPSDGLVTSEKNILVEGTATDNIELAQVSVNGVSAEVSDSSFSSLGSSLHG